MNRDQRKSFLVALGLNRPVTLLMLASVILLLGSVAYVKMPIQLLPSGFSSPFLWVQIMYPNATPTEVEKEVLKPWENLLGTVNGIRRIHGRANSNWAGTFIRFNSDMDMSTAYNQIRDRLERIKAQLPSGAGESYIWRFDPNDEEVVSFAWPLIDLADDIDVFIEKQISQPLERLPGVSRVEVTGLEKRKLTIEPRLDALKAFGVRSGEVFALLKSDNWVMASGKLQESGREIWVRSVGKLTSIEDYKMIPIRPGLYLKDIADIKLTREKKETINRLNGRATVFIEVFKSSEANTVEISKMIINAIENLTRNESRIEEDSFVVLKNQGNEIEEAIAGLQDSALLGGLIAILILFVFIRRFALTAIMASMIPLSVLMATAGLFFKGESLNVMTFMGFMVAVGMVVDNSVVVCEAIDKKQKSGMDKFRAAKEGATEVGLAITTSTFTTVVVFLPIGLLGGKSQVSFFLEKMGLPVCLALLSSLFASLYFVPSMCRFLLPRLAPHGNEQPSTVVKMYKNILRFCLLKPTWVITISLITFSASYWMSTQVPRGEHSGLGTFFRVHINFPGNMSFAARNIFLKEFEWAALEKKDEYRVKALRTHLEEARSTAHVNFLLHNRSQGDMSTPEIIEQIRSIVPKRAGVTHQLGWKESTRQAEASITLSLFGPDSEYLVTLAEQVEKKLLPYKEFSRVEVAPEAKTNEEIQIQIRRDQATRLGLSAVDVAGSLAGTMRGTQLPLFDKEGEQVEVWLRGQEGWRQNIEQAMELPMAPRSSKSIATHQEPHQVEPVILGSISETQIGKTFGSIIRRDRKTAITININTNEKDRDYIYKLIRAEMNTIQWPEQYSFDLGERFEQRRHDKKAEMDAFLYALLLVFVLMGVLFESFLLPFSVILSVPFAISGAFIALYISGSIFDLTCGVGMVVLVGVIVNNAIVFVDRVQFYLKQSIAVPTALLAAGEDRLRPIVMTAASTVGGLIPMAMGDGAVMGVPYATVGIVVIGGLILGTVLTLILLPTLLQGIYKVRDAFTRS